MHSMALTDTLRQNAVSELDENERVSTVLAPPTFGAPNQISASTLSSTPTLREAPPAPLTDFGAFVRSLTPDTTQLDRRGEELRDDISGTLGDMETRGARQTEIEAELGLPEDRQRLRELNLQIAQLQGDFNEAIVNEEGVARPIEFITGRQDFLQKKSAVMVGALTSVAQALQGNITLAEQTAERTIEREFADEEARLRTLEFEYTENKEALEKADRKGADRLALYLDERKRVLAEQKDERKNVLAIAQEAALNGAPNSIVSRVAGATSQEQALSLAGSWLSENAGTGVTGGGITVSPDGTKVITLPDGSTKPLAGIDLSNAAEVEALPVSNITKAVMNGYVKAKDLTPTQKGEVAGELQQIGFNPNTYVLNKLSSLVETWQSVPESSRGLVEGNKFWERWTDPEVAAFESQRELLTREVARLFDVGVLSDQDVAAYQNAMPSRRDSSLEVVLNKAAGIAGAAAGINPENVGKRVILDDGREAIVGADGNTLLDPKTGRPIE